MESLNSEAAAKNEEDAKTYKDAQRLEKKGPNKRMEAGKKLSPKYAADFQMHLAGIPLIDIDPYYKEKEVCSCLEIRLIEMMTLFSTCEQARSLTKWRICVYFCVTGVHCSG